MSLKNLGTGPDMQSEWSRMFVGPILERDGLLRGEESVAQGVFYGPAAATQPLESGVAASKPQESSEQSVSPKSSSFYFGSANSVIEINEDGQTSKFWVRLQNSLSHVNWLKLEYFGKQYV